MQAVFGHLDFFLNLQESVSLKRAAHTAVTVKRGSVWVTQDGNREDYVLEAGQTWRIEGDATVIVSALHASEIALDEGRRRGWAQQLGRNWMARYLRWVRRATADTRNKLARAGAALLQYAL